MALQLLSDLPWQVVDAGGGGAAEQLEYFRAKAFLRLRGQLPSDRAPGPFWGAIRTFTAGAVTFSENASAAMDAVRLAGDCANDGTDDFTIYAQLQGESRVEQNGRRVVVRP